MDRRPLPASFAALAMATAAGAAQHSVPGDHASIQNAIDAAANGDVIVVQPGTWHETIDFDGKAVTVRSAAGPEATVLDGSGLGGSVVRCVSGEGSGTVLEGFTVSGGTGTFEGTRRKGGGMFNRQSTPTVRNCMFVQNTVSAYEFNIQGSGGGMYNEQASPTVVDCTFANNQLLGCSGWLNGGAGMYNDGGNPTVTGCRFLFNVGNNGGGMMNINGAAPTVANCVFDGNVVAYSGGGINNTHDSTASVTNCLFRRNEAWHGAALYATQATIELVNCTVSDNTALWRAAGLYTLSPSSPASVTNCIFWGNTLFWEQVPPGEDPPGPEEKEIAHYGAYPAQVSWTTVENGWAGTGNSAADPQFVFADGGNMRLRDDSPAIDAGTSGAVPADGLDLDGDGNTSEPCPDLDLSDRVAGGAVDMGAYEVPDYFAVAADVTGNGVVDVHDLLAVLVSWGPCTGGPCPADVDGDGEVETDDLVLVLEHWA